MSRVDNDYRLYDGVATTDSTSPSGLPVDNLFDNNPSTEWSAPIEPLIQVTYTFNYRRHEWFNTYTLTSSGSYPERDPTTWRLEGSKDGLTWNRIDYQSNYVFSGRRQTATFMVKSNRVSYNMLRLVIIKVRGATESIAQLSEFAIYASEGELLESGLSYETTEFTYMSAITENFSIKPVSSGYLNFAINPALPAGITIDADSGEISGSTTETTAALSDYTITATDSCGNFTRSGAKRLFADFDCRWGIAPRPKEFVFAAIIVHPGALVNRLRPLRPARQRKGWGRRFPVSRLRPLRPACRGRRRACSRSSGSGCW